MPVLKTATCGTDFQRDAKKYVINMQSGARKLHIKNCKTCHYSGVFTKYYDFDSVEEAKASGISYTLCGLCFRGQLR